VGINTSFAVSTSGIRLGVGQRLESKMHARACPTANSSFPNFPLFSNSAFSRFFVTNSMSSWPIPLVDNSSSPRLNSTIATLPPMATAYQYSKLPPDSIRLLRLRPHRDPTASIRCTLFDCPLLQSHEQVTFSLYEALSYVWGSTDNPQSILVRDCPISYDDDDETPAPDSATARARNAGTLSITRNLHEALVQLRDRFIERVLWIDAICINQADLDERSCQVASMARIYAIASRVLVWLGPAGDDGAAEALAKCVVPTRHRFPARAVVVGELAESSSGAESLWERAWRQSAVTGGTVPDLSSQDSQDISEGARENHSWLFPIFQRPWFRRIWVLQEVAAARHVLVLCGSVTIDGLALYACTDALVKEQDHTGDSETRSKLQSGVNLMKDTFQRNGQGGVDSFPDPATMMSQQFTLAIAPLAGLLDMYLTRQATDVRDKVYALLGMCSDDLRISGLTPDYSRPLGKFFDLVCEHLFGMVPISVKTSGNRHVVGMRGPGRVLGRVRGAYAAQLGMYQLDIEFTVFGLWSKHDTWRVRVPTVRKGDLFFIAPGARWPMIGRVVDDSVLIVAAVASCEAVDKIDWPGTNASFWPEIATWGGMKDFWASDLWLLWDWPGTEPPRRRSELFENIFSSRHRSERWKSLAVIYWGVECYESAETATQAFLQEFEQETKHATKSIIEDDQLPTLSDPKHGLQMEFEVLVSQFPDCREKQGLLGLWYLKRHLPPLSAEEEKLLFETAASPSTRFDEFHPHPRYEEDLLYRAQRIREEYYGQTIPSLRHRRSSPQLQKLLDEEPSVEAEHSLFKETDGERDGRHGSPYEKDDLGEECMLLATTESHYIQGPEGWLWFRLACHRRGQTLRVTPRVLKALRKPSTDGFRVRESIFRILLNSPKGMFVVVEGLQITPEMYEESFVRLWRLGLQWYGRQWNMSSA